MNVEDIRAHCLSFKGVEESFPFGEHTLVFKVGGKIFLLLALDSQPLQFNVKCDPEEAIKLREKYSWVIPGYHMNKRHWNTVVFENQPPKKLIFDWINHAYFLVYNNLPKKIKSDINAPI